ncbi:MAG: CBS domain-containing protein [Planctomycetes bacterium]|nr:CBS domain-containing protein [Planctomycetota bacterium]
MESQNGAAPRLIDALDRIYAGKEVFFHFVKTVGDLMCGLKFLTMDESVEDALRFMEEHQVRHIPIVEVEELTREDTRAGRQAEPRSLVGILSQRDLARFLSKTVGTLVETDEDARSPKTPLGSLVTRNPKTVAEATPILEAIQLFLSEKIDCLPVVRGEKPVGILTTTDVIRCFVRLQIIRKARGYSRSEPGKLRAIDLLTAQSNAPKPTEELIDSLFGTVGDVMRMAVVTLTTKDSIRKAIELMKKHSFRHLPVVEGKILKGIVSDRDVLRHLPPLPRSAPGAKREGGEFRERLFYLEEGDDGLLDESVATVMTSQVVTVEPGTSIYEVAELFCSKNFSSVPVVATKGGSSVVGILTHTDFLTAIVVLARLSGGSQAP